MDLNKTEIVKINPNVLHYDSNEYISLFEIIRAITRYSVGESFEDSVVQAESRIYKFRFNLMKLSWHGNQFFELNLKDLSREPLRTQSVIEFIHDLIIDSFADPYGFDQRVKYLQITLCKRSWIAPALMPLNISVELPAASESNHPEPIEVLTLRQELSSVTIERDILCDELELLRQQQLPPSTRPAAEPDAGDMATQSYNKHAKAWASLAMAQGVTIHGAELRGLTDFHERFPMEHRPSLNWLKEVINYGRRMIPAPPLDAK